MKTKFGEFSPGSNETKIGKVTGLNKWAFILNLILGTLTLQWHGPHKKEKHGTSNSMWTKVKK